MKKIFLLIFFSLIFSNVFSQNVKRPDAEHADWRILEKAQVAFDAGKYGEAVKLTNAAKKSHESEISWQVNILTNALSPSAVRKEGDSFSEILPVLKERDENVAIELINSYIKKYGESYFDSSVSKLVSWINNKHVYPEADFLLGRVYELEGEYDLAERYFESARQNSIYLNIPDEKIDILYAMAELSFDKKDYEVYEQTLLLILSGDSYFNNETFMKALFRTIDSDKEKSVDNFFELYRSETKNTLRALNSLEQLYDEKGEKDKALRCASLGVIESFTHIFASIKERDSEYIYTDLSSFLVKAGAYDDIVEWGKTNKVWGMFVSFADLCAERGKLVFARKAYSILSESLPDNYWKEEAACRLIVK